MAKATASAACCAPRSRPLLREMKQHARMFKALGDETRLEIVGLLTAAADELCVCDIERHFELSQPTISHHLRILRDAALVTSERRGTWVYYRLNQDAAALLAALTRLLQA